MGPTNQSNVFSNVQPNNSTANDSSSSSYTRLAGTALIVLLSAGNVLVVIWGLLQRRLLRISNAVLNREMAKEGRNSFDDDMSELAFDVLSVPSWVVVMGDFEQEMEFESVGYFRGAKKSDTVLLLERRIAPPLSPSALFIENHLVSFQHLQTLYTRTLHRVYISASVTSIYVGAINLSLFSVLYV